jgi:hypothetical protein
LLSVLLLFEALRDLFDSYLALLSRCHVVE